MAAVNEASIRVTANTAPFQQKMRRAGAHVRQTARKMETALGTSLADGFDKGVEASKELASSVRDIATQAATLGGLFSAGAMVSGAIKAEKANIALANSLSIATKKFVEVNEVQKLAEDTANATGQSFEESREQLALLAATADQFDLTQMVKESSMMAQRLDMDGNKVAEVMSRIAKTGVADTAQGIAEVTEQAGLLAREMLGISLEEAFDPADLLELITFMNRGDLSKDQALNLFGLGAGFSKDMGKAIEIAEEFGDALSDVKELEAIRSAAGFKKGAFTGKSTTEIFTKIMSKGKGIKEFTNALGFQAKQALEGIVGKELLEKAQSGKRIKTSELEEAQAKVAALMGKQASVQVDFNANEKRNAELMNTNAVKIQLAMNKLETAFQSEEVAKAITVVADSLPLIVEPIAELVKNVAEFPKTAIATLIAGKIGLAFAGAAVQSAAGSGVSVMMDMLTKKLMGHQGALVGFENISKMDKKAFLASKALQALKTTAGVALAGFAGFQFGTWLGEQLGIFKAQERQLTSDFDKKLEAESAGSMAESALASGSKGRIESAKMQTEVALANVQTGASAQGTLTSNLLTGFGLFGETMNDQLASQVDPLVKNLAKLNAALGLSADHQSKTLKVMKENAGMGAPGTGGNTTRGTPNIGQVVGAVAVPG